MAFELDVAKWVSKVQGNMDEALRQFTLEFARRMIDRTPYETGNAKGAWAAGVNSVPTIDDKAAPDDKDGAATLARIAAVIATAKAGDVIWLVNGSDYAWALEYGRSEQAPAGMLRLTLSERDAIAREVVAKLRT